MHYLSSIITCAAIFSAVTRVQAEIPLKAGDKVAFLGDSITQGGNASPGGYVQMVGSGLAANGVKIEIIGAGVSGHKSNQMLDRLEKDVLSKKPQWMTLSCGVNDVWHGAKGVSIEDYKKNITEIVDKAQAAGIKVVLLTSTMITEDQANPNNQKLIPYNEFLRQLAVEKKCLLADLNADMQAALEEARKQPKTGNYLTSDGVHMAYPGNQMMATGVLKGFGLNAVELNKATEAWLDLPNAVNLSSKLGITPRQYKQLEKVAAAQKLSVDALANEVFKKNLEALIQNP